MWPYPDESCAELLDLIFTNDSCNAEVTRAPPLVPVECHHPPLLLSFEWHFSHNEPNVISTGRNFSKGDYVSLNRFLDSANIEACLIGKSLEEMVDVLDNILSNAIEQFIPTYTRKRNLACPWSTKQLQKLKNRRNKEWKKFKITGDRSHYDTAFAAFDALNTELYNDYVRKMSSSLNSNPHTFWQFVNSKKKTNNNPTFLKYRDKSSSDVQMQADLFAEFFATNFNEIDNESANEVQSPTIDTNEQFVLDEYTVFDALSNIDTTKGLGPDGIHPLLLKNCSALLCRPLSIIFNKSLSSGVFPSKWKRSSVRPIFKKGAKSNTENYRCIAKLPTIAKLFESIFNIKMTECIRRHIIPQQHGFTKHRSTVTNLMEFSNFVHKNRSTQVDVLYTDFMKAFDKVNHRKLLSKLGLFGLPGNLLMWLKSYLSDRCLFVNYESKSSVEFVANSGVPQGSHLGPTLFLLFINDIAEKFGDDIFLSLFADDLKIAVVIRTHHDTVKLQTAIEQLREWCNENDLHLNLNKCCIMSISNKLELIDGHYCYGSQQFQRVQQQKDLGVIIDAKMKFNGHIDAITSKAASTLGFVKRFCHDVREVNVRKSLFYSLVQSVLEYCSIVCFPFYECYKDKIESVLVQFTMYALNEYPNANNDYKITNYNGRLGKLEMISLQRRRINTALMFIYDLVYENLHCPLLREEIAINENHRNLRHSTFTPFSIRDKHLKLHVTAPINQACNLANIVKQLFLTPVSRNSFKNSIKSLNDGVFGDLAKVKKYSRFNITN